MKISFDEKTSSIILDGIACELPHDKNGAAFCKVLLSESQSKPMSWDQIAQEIEGETFNLSRIEDQEKKRRSIQDTMYDVNRRVRDKMNTDDDLFTWKGKSISRNF